MESVALKSLYARVAYLAACALSDKCPDASLLSGVSAEKLYNLARRHGMGALITHSLERLSLATDEMLADSFKAARKIMLLDAERAMITRELNSRGIRHIALKGVVIKELYPKIGLREMSDNDILFDPGYRAEVRDIFKSRGYTVNLPIPLLIHTNKMMALKTIKNRDTIHSDILFCFFKIISILFVFISPSIPCCPSFAKYCQKKILSL